MPTGASSITTHRAGGRPSALGGDEEDLRVGLAVLNVAAGDDRAEPLLHAQPLDRRGHVFARRRRAHGHAEPCFMKSRDEIRRARHGGEVNGDDAAEVGLFFQGHGLHVIVAESARPPELGHRVAGRAAETRLELLLADRESAAASHLQPALIMGIEESMSTPSMSKIAAKFKRHIRCFALGLGENAEIWRSQGEESRGGIERNGQTFGCSVLSTQYSVLSTQYSVLSTQYSVLSLSTLRVASFPCGRSVGTIKALK